MKVGSCLVLVRFAELKVVVVPTILVFICVFSVVGLPSLILVGIRSSEVAVEWEVNDVGWTEVFSWISRAELEACRLVVLLVAEVVRGRVWELDVTTAKVSWTVPVCKDTTLIGDSVISLVAVLVITPCVDVAASI